MRMQRLKKTNGQKIAELLATVTACSCIGYSNEHTTFSSCFETMGELTCQEDKYASLLEWFWVCAGVTKNTIWVLLFGTVRVCRIKT